MRTTIFFPFIHFFFIVLLIMPPHQHVRSVKVGTTSESLPFYCLSLVLRHIKSTQYLLIKEMNEYMSEYDCLSGHISKVIESRGFIK